MSPRFAMYSSGVLKMCKPAVSTSSFKAVKNITSADELSVLYIMPFDELSCRMSDRDFAQSMGHSLDLKVRVRYRPDIDTTLRVLIGSVLYSIYEFDADADRLSLYLYLQRERELS